MTELTEERIREIVREEMRAETKRRKSKKFAGTFIPATLTAPKPKTLSNVEHQ